jgi:retinol dehydrogenase-12
MGDQRTGIVTGANSGIGLETARGLAAAGFRTVLLCRNPSRAEVARADIASTHPDAELHVVLCDLGRQAEVRRAAAEIEERFDDLDVLVNNAAVTLRKKEVTSEGVDAMLATNHLGPFLLTNLLLPLLERSAPSRIVNVASDAHKFGRLHLEDLQCERRGYGPLGMRRYGETKTMNILFTRALAKRLEGTGVTANCLHPGGVSTNLGAPPKVIAKLTELFLKTPADGARTSHSCALDPAWAGVRGRYFVKSEPADGRLGAQAKDDALAEALWARSAELVGL